MGVVEVGMFGICVKWFVDLLLHCRLISRHGYVVVDETYRPQFTSDPDWPWVTTANASVPTPDMCNIDPSDVRDFPSRTYPMTSCC